MRRCLILTSLIHLILFSGCIEKVFSKTSPRLLIISLDGKEKKIPFVSFSFFIKGFAHKYLEKYSSLLPTINGIQNEGIKTKHGMQPTFVTMTYPNHISIATGRMNISILIIHLPV